MSNAALLGHLVPLAVQTIATAGLVLSVVLPVTLSGRKAAKQGAQHAAQANEQVTNTHRTNLRHDLDGMADDIRDVLKQITTVHESLGKLWSHVRRQDDRMGDLEHTIDPHETGRSRWAPPNEGSDHDRPHDPPRPVEGHQPEGGGLRDRSRLRRSP